MRSAYRAGRGVGYPRGLLRLRFERTSPRPPRRPQSRSQLGDHPLFGRQVPRLARRLYRLALKAAPSDAVRRSADGSQSPRHCAWRVVDLARSEAEKLFTSDPKGRGDDAVRPTRSGRWDCSRRPSSNYKDALAIAPDLARVAITAWPRRSRRASISTTRMNEAQAALRMSSAAISKSITPSARFTNGCTSTKRRPAPTRTTSTCCPTRITARRPTGRAPKSPLPALVRPARAVRLRSRHRRPSSIPSISGW